MTMNSATILATTNYYWKKHAFSLKARVFLLILIGISVMLSISFSLADPATIDIPLGTWEDWFRNVVVLFTIALYAGQFGALSAIIIGSYASAEGYEDHSFLFETAYPLSREEHFIGRVISSMLISGFWVLIGIIATGATLFIAGSLKFGLFHLSDIGTLLILILTTTLYIFFLNILFLGVTWLVGVLSKKPIFPLVLLTLYVFFIDSLIPYAWPIIEDFFNFESNPVLSISFHVELFINFILGDPSSPDYFSGSFPWASILSLSSIGIGLLIVSYKVFKIQDL